MKKYKWLWLGLLLIMAWLVPALGYALPEGNQIICYSQKLKTQTEKLKTTIEPLSEQDPVTICIDPGHQQKGDYAVEPLAPGSSLQKPRCSSGTQGVQSRVPEGVVNLQLGVRLKAQLESKGYKVVMTRDVQEINISNAERAQVANNAEADLFIRIHNDGAAKSSTKGITVLYPGALYIGQSLSDTSYALGQSVLNGMVAETGAVNRGLVMRTDITGFNYAKMPVVLVECGFMTNPEEDWLLNSPEYQDKLVSGIVTGIEGWLGVQ